MADQAQNSIGAIKELFALITGKDYPKLVGLLTLLSLGAVATAFLPLLLKWAVDANDSHSNAAFLAIALYATLLILRSVANEARTVTCH